MEVDSKYIKFESVDHFSKISIQIVDHVESNFEIDSDMIPAKTSVSNLILNDSMSEGNEIGCITFYNLEPQENWISDAVKLEFINGQIIFLDPSYYFGINIGGKEQEQIWKDNLEESVCIKETCIRIADDMIGQRQEEGFYGKRGNFRNMLQ